MKNPKPATDAEHLRLIYAKALRKNWPCHMAYDYTRRLFRELGGTIADSSNNHCCFGNISDYPTLIIDFTDGSQARLMLGGVNTAPAKHWTSAV